METSNSLPNLRKYSQELPPKISSTYEIIGESSSLSSSSSSCLEGNKEGLRRHQRTYSDSMLSEQEVPYWLKDLLDDVDEPEYIISSRTHRRSSSDSMAYLHDKTILQDSETKEHDTFQKHNNNNFVVAADPQHSFLHQHHSRTDSKRVKRHSAQQYRARKVQYIGELERSIQALQAEGYEVSAELEFLDQQNLILGMENRALKQRLDSLSQEHFIKCLEQEMLEKEITRLRNLYQQQQHKQQQHQQQKHLGRNRPKRQDLDSSIAKLSF